MANNGFNAATDIFSMGAKWKVKSSDANASGSVAECPNAVGDTTHRDAYAQRIAPTAEYTCVDDVDELPDLGTVVTIDEKKIMITQIVVKTAKGSAPTASVSGTQVNDNATTRRTYSCGEIALSARHKAQDILGMLGENTPDTLTESTFTFSISPSLADPKGVIANNDCADGKVVAQFTHTSGTGAAISAPAVSGAKKVVSDPVSKTSPENDYVTVTYSVTDSLVGAEPT